MSLTKRHIKIDGDMPVREVLRLLDIPGDSVIMLVPRGTVRVQIHSDEPDRGDTMTFEEMKELARSAIGGGQGLIDLGELERQVYESRDQEPSRPPVVLD